MSEDNPFSKLTKWLTEGKDDPNEKTRVMTKEQLEFYYVYLSLSKIHGIHFYKDIVEIDEQLMMSHKGQRSDDVVKALVGVEKEKEEDAGIQPIRRFMKKKAEENNE